MMKIFYRMCDHKLSTSNPPPKGYEQVFKIHADCIETFIKAFEDEEVDVTFICDFCESNQYEHLARSVPFKHNVIKTQLGINGTCLKQYDLYKASNHDKVLFLEYDYFWKPETGKEIIKALDEFDFITPYDHPDKYEKETEPEVKVLNGRHWKVTESTTATFATTRKKFMEYEDLFYKYGYLDHQRWLDIKERGGKLWSPIPAIATHMVRDFISPNVDWKFEKPVTYWE